MDFKVYGFLIISFLSRQRKKRKPLLKDMQENKRICVLCLRETDSFVQNALPNNCFSSAFQFRIHLLCVFVISFRYS